MRLTKTWLTSRAATINASTDLDKLNAIVDELEDGYQMTQDFHVSHDDNGGLVSALVKDITDELGTDLDKLREACYDRIKTVEAWHEERDAAESTEIEMHGTWNFAQTGVTR